MLIVNLILIAYKMKLKQYKMYVSMSFDTLYSEAGHISSTSESQVTPFVLSPS